MMAIVMANDSTEEEDGGPDEAHGLVEKLDFLHLFHGKEGATTEEPEE